MTTHAQKLGLCKAKDALVLIYSDGTKLRQRLMPVRNLDVARGVSCCH